MPKSDEIVTVSEIARRLGVAPSTARQAIRMGRIPSIELGPRRKVTMRTAFEEYMRTGQIPQADAKPAVDMDDLIRKFQLSMLQIQRDVVEQAIQNLAAELNTESNGFLRSPNSRR